KSEPTAVGLHSSLDTDEIAPAGQAGPVTLMDRLLLRDLPWRRGPSKRLLDRPLVLLVLFLATVGLIAWAFWPLSPETMYERGAALMASSDPDDWETAWSKYLGPLEEKHPNHGHQSQVAEYKRRLNDYRAGREGF